MADEKYDISDQGDSGMKKNYLMNVTRKLLWLVAGGCFLGLGTWVNQAHAATVSGTISGFNGEEICVTAIPSLGGSGCEDMDWGNTVGIGSNAGDGTYTITESEENFPEGDYYLWFDAGCGDTNSSTYLIAEYWTSDGEGTTDCNQAGKFNTSESISRNIILAAGGRISGTISGTNGQDVCINANSLSDGGQNGCDAWNWVGGGMAGSDGTYSFRAPAGTYYLSTDTNCSGSNPNNLPNEMFTNDGQGTSDCSQADTVTVSTNATTSGNNVALEEGAVVSGTISGTLGQEVCVDIMELPSGGTNGCDMLIPIANTSTAADGSYSVVVPGGDFYLSINPDCYDGVNENFLIGEFWTNDDQGSSDCALANSFTVAAGESTTKNLTLEQGAVISGTISGTNGDSVCVTARKLRDGSTNSCDTDWIAGWGTEPDGSFSFIAPPGTYYLDISADCGDGNPYNLVNEYWTSDGEGTPYCNQAESSEFSVGTNPDKNLTLAPGGFISGTITRVPDTGDWNDLEVIVLYFNGEWYQWLHSGPVNSDGTYTTNPLPTGNFYVQFRDNNNQFQEELYNNVPTWDPEAAQLVTVTAPATTSNINATLQHITDDRYHPAWTGINTWHDYDNTSMTTTTSATGDLQLKQFDGSENAGINYNFELSVTTPSGTCNDDNAYADMAWRLRVNDNNGNGIIDDDEQRSPAVLNWFGNSCNFGSTPHAAGTYTFNATLPDSTVLTKTMTGVSAGLTTSQIPPVTGLTANWNSPADDELTLSWTLPGTAYPDGSDIEIRVYTYKNGTPTNNQIRVSTLPIDATHYTFPPEYTIIFFNRNVDQILVQVRTRKWDGTSMTMSRNLQAYTVDYTTDTLTPAPAISMTLLDINGDGKTGLEEAIHSLKTISGY